MHQPWLSLIANEWTDIKSNKCYVPTNGREFDAMLHISINFLGFDQLDDIKGEMVTNSILETLKCNNPNPNVREAIK
jgi:hypothetical protein